MDSKVKYKAQALAIAMVVLVVSSLIAISVYSRTMKDKGLTLEERSSAEALEVSDILIDRLVQFPMSTVIDEILTMDLIEVDAVYPYGTGVVLKENNNGTNNITELFTGLGIPQTVSELLGPICPIDKGGEYQITLKETDGDTYYEVKPGNVWSLPVKNLITQPDCNVDIKLAVRGDTRAGFTLMKIYCRYDDDGNVIDCKEYEYDDVDNYCFSNDGIECNNINFMDNDNWVKYDPDTGEEYIDIDLPQSDNSLEGTRTGMVITPLINGITSFEGNDIAVDSGKNIYIVGAVRDTGSPDWGIQKFNENGELDTEWGSEGFVRVVSGSYDIAYAITVDDEDNIYVAGGDYVAPTTSSKWVIRKYDTSGELDTFWGNSGVVTYDSSSSGQLMASDIVVDNDKNIYVVGDYSTHTGNRNWGIRKYTEEGILDTSWGSEGMITYGTANLDHANAITIDSQKNIYVAGNIGISTPTNYDWVVRKYDENGVRDLSWGDNGAVVYEENSGAPMSVEIDSTGGIWVVGSEYSLSEGIKWRILRYDSEGEFVVSSSYDFSEEPADSDYATDIVIAPDGSAFVVGAINQNNDDWVVRKYLPDGSLDTGWNEGMVTYDSISNSPFNIDIANGVVIDNEGSIYVVGRSGVQYSAARKYLSDGNLDENWGDVSSPVLGVLDGDRKGEDLERKSLFQKILQFFKMTKASAATPSPDEYVLSEIRIKAIGGTIGVSYILPEQCLTGLRMFQLRATANCAGIYRGKEVLIPEQKWHNTIFDYVIFNGEGSL